MRVGGNVATKRVDEAEAWPWSSYRATLGLDCAPAFPTTDWLLSDFGLERRDAAAAFARFVGEGAARSPWRDLRGQIFLGSEGFVAEMHRQPPSGWSRRPSAEQRKHFHRAP